MLALDKIYEDNLLIPHSGRTKQIVASEEAKRLKRLMSSLRHLFRNCFPAELCLLCLYLRYLKISMVTVIWEGLNYQPYSTKFFHLPVLPDILTQDCSRPGDQQRPLCGGAQSSAYQIPRENAQKEGLLQYFHNTTTVSLKVNSEFKI